MSAEVEPDLVPAGGDGRRQSGPPVVRRLAYDSFMTQIWVRRYDSFEAEAEGDAQFWLEMTPEARVALVDQIRREWQELNGQVDQRLRRTARVFSTP